MFDYFSDKCIILPEEKCELNFSLKNAELIAYDNCSTIKNLFEKRKTSAHFFSVDLPTVNVEKKFYYDISDTRYKKYALIQTFFLRTGITLTADKRLCMTHETHLYAYFTKNASSITLCSNKPILFQLYEIKCSADGDDDYPEIENKIESSYCYDLSLDKNIANELHTKSIGAKSANFFRDCGGYSHLVVKNCTDFLYENCDLLYEILNHKNFTTNSQVTGYITWLIYNNDIYQDAQDFFEK